MRPGHWSRNGKSERKRGTDFGEVTTEDCIKLPTDKTRKAKPITKKSPNTVWLKGLSEVTLQCMLPDLACPRSRAVPEKSVSGTDLRPYTLYQSVLPGSLLEKRDLHSQNGHISKLSGTSEYVFQFETHWSVPENNTEFLTVSQRMQMLIAGPWYLTQAFPEQ